MKKSNVKSSTAEPTKRRVKPGKPSKIFPSFVVLSDLGGKSYLPPSDLFRTMKHFNRRNFFFRAPLPAMLVSGSNKPAEQWMRLQRLRLELWMKLAADEMRMIRQFPHLDISTVRR